MLFGAVNPTGIYLSDLGQLTFLFQGNFRHVQSGGTVVVLSARPRAKGRGRSPALPFPRRDGGWPQVREGGPWRFGLEHTRNESSEKWDLGLEVGPGKWIRTAGGGEQWGRAFQIGGCEQKRKRDLLPKGAIMALWGCSLPTPPPQLWKVTCVRWRRGCG